MTKVFIDGSAGTTGLRIGQRLSQRKDLQLLTIDEHLRKDDGARRDYLNQADVAGVLMDKDDPSTLVPKLTVSQAKALQGQGIISGGMIPKVDCCMDAIAAGVENVVMMDGRVPHSILMELLTDEGAGTMVTQG